MTIPGARLFSATALSNDGAQFYVYGGRMNLYGWFYNDLWVYTFATRQWTWISGSSSTGQYATTPLYGKPHPNNVPGSRGSHALSVDPLGHLYVTSGAGYSNVTLLSSNENAVGTLNNIWIYQLSCPPGYFGRTISNQSCFACPIGTFKENYGNGDSSAVCLTCPTGYTTVSTGNSNITQCVCDIGFGFVNNGCILCNADTYKSTVGNSVCSACDVKSTTNGLLGAISSGQCLCKSGFFSTLGNSSCTACPANTYKSTITNGASSSVCVPCGANSTTNSATGINAQAGCLCKSGYYGTGNLNCELCPMGSFKPLPGNGDATVCQSCPSNSITDPSQPPTSSSSCKCIAGFFGLSGTTITCNPCPAGYYKSSIGNGLSSAVCSICPTGTWGTATGATSLSACNICRRGFEGSASSTPGSGCTACKADFFKAHDGNAACAPCTTTSTTLNSTGSTSASACKCLPGYYGSSGHTSCVRCPVNTFKEGPAVNSASCTSCHTFASTMGVLGATSGSNCICTAGHYGNGTFCAKCKQDTFKQASGNGLEVSVCINCPQNATTLGDIGVTDPNVCTCPAGYGGLNEDSPAACHPCPVDSFKTSAGKTNCIKCNENSTTDGAIATIISSGCLCHRGFYGINGHDSCISCEPNSYKSAIANSETCTKCATNAVTNQTQATQASACKCERGFYGIGYLACFACPVDSFKPIISNGDQDQVCISCPVNATTQNNIGQTSILDCSCAPGYYGMETAALSDSCKPCPIGTYKSVYGHGDSSAVCTPCGGNMSTLFEGATSLSQCECLPGFGYDSATYSCSICSENQFKNNVGNASCSKCPLFTTTNGQSGMMNSSQCECERGYYFDTTDTGCKACPVNTFKAIVGNLQLDEGCIPCPASLSTTNGETAVISIDGCVCPPGYSGLPGIDCQKCPVNTYKSNYGNSRYDNVTNTLVGLQFANGTTLNITQEQLGDILGKSTVIQTRIFVETRSVLVDSCSPCPNNSITEDMEGQQSSASCVCKAGYYGLDGALLLSMCELCPKGTYKTDSLNGGPSLCLPCAIGYITSSVASTSSSECDVCDANYEGNGKTSGCSPCKDGFEKPMAGNGFCSRKTIDPNPIQPTTAPLKNDINFFESPAALAIFISVGVIITSALAAYYFVHRQRKRSKTHLKTSKVNPMGTASDISGTRSDITGTQSDISGTRSVVLGTQSDISATCSDIYGTHPDIFNSMRSIEDSNEFEDDIPTISTEALSLTNATKLPPLPRKNGLATKLHLGSSPEIHGSNIVTDKLSLSGTSLYRTPTRSIGLLGSLPALPGLTSKAPKSTFKNNDKFMLSESKVEESIAIDSNESHGSSKVAKQSTPKSNPLRWLFTKLFISNHHTSPAVAPEIQITSIDSKDLRFKNKKDRGQSKIGALFESKVSASAELPNLHTTGSVKRVGMIGKNCGSLQNGNFSIRPIPSSLLNSEASGLNEVGSLNGRLSGIPSTRNISSGFTSVGVGLSSRLSNGAQQNTSSSRVLSVNTSLPDATSQTLRKPANSLAPPLPPTMLCRSGIDFALTLNNIGGSDIAQVYEADVSSLTILNRADTLKVSKPFCVKVFTPSHTVANIGSLKSQLGWWNQVSKHPNIVKVLGYAEEPSFTIITPFYENTFSKIVYDKTVTLPLSPKDIVRDLVSAIQKMHMMGISHGNLKPTNLFFDRVAGDDGKTWKVLVSDVGFDSRKTITHPHHGDLAYLSPEAIYDVTDPNVTSKNMGVNNCLEIMSRHKSKDVKFKIDIYALGIVIYELIERGKAWDGVKDLIPRVLRGERPTFKEGVLDTENLKSLAKECWAQECSQRPTIHELEDNLV